MERGKLGDCKDHAKGFVLEVVQRSRPHGLVIDPMITGEQWGPETLGTYRCFLRLAESTALLNTETRYSGASQYFDVHLQHEADVFFDPDIGLGLRNPAESGASSFPKIPKATRHHLPLEDAVRLLSTGARDRIVVTFQDLSRREDAQIGQVRQWLLRNGYTCFTCDFGQRTFFLFLARMGNSRSAALQTELEAALGVVAGKRLTGGSSP